MLLLFSPLNLQFDLLQFSIVAINNAIKNAQSNGMLLILRTVRHSLPSCAAGQSVMIVAMVIMIVGMTVVRVTVV